MSSKRLRDDPLRALLWIEAIAFALAFAGDVYAALTMRFDLTGSLAASLKAYIPLVAVTGVLVFTIPHSPNGRFPVIGGAIVGICALPLIPSPGVSSLVLLAILAARLTFAFGSRGAALALGTALAAILCDAVASHWGPAHLSTGETLFGIYGLSIQVTLVFGMIGVMWLYAKSSSSAAASAERARIALDLHDSLGHALTALLVQLQNAEQSSDIDPSRAAKYVKRATATATELLADVRETVAILHHEEAASTPPLASMLARLHDDFTSTHPLQTTWSVQLKDEPSGRVSMAIYRVVQEALTNVVRHAQAAHVRVFVCSSDREIDLRVEDDGRGLHGTEGTGHGLHFMRMRVENVGGIFSVSSNGTGTQLRALIPLEARR
jgi:signal transduction histidine kinase